MKVDKDYGYIPDLQKAILHSRISSQGGMPRRRSQRPDDPRQYGVLCGIPPPTTEELLQTQVSRRKGTEAISEGIIQHYSFTNHTCFHTNSW